MSHGFKVMNYLLQGIPNDIYNSVDACQDAKIMWERIKSPSNSHTPQPYYVTHPSSVIDYEEDCQGELQGDAQEDKLTTAMIDRVDIQSKNVGYAGNGNRNAGRQNRYQASNRKMVWFSRLKKMIRLFSGFYELSQIRERQMEQMLLTMKDEAAGNLDGEENDFMLDNAYEDDTLEELTAAIIMMARIQPADDKGVHEQTNHEKIKTDINTSDDAQIDCNIIFDDPYVENNDGIDEHDSNAHD
ncbi:hypothetical protein Tco_0132784 [Tanacetum coccineum]